MAVTRFPSLRIFRRLFSETNSCKRLNILGIETSCDDTCAAVVNSDRNVLGQSKCSQTDIHTLHGGILPTLACSLHRKNIKKVVSEALEQSQVDIKDLDAIAVTVKPGMKDNLEVGLEYAKDLCTLYGKPLIPVHHMEAHALTPRLVADVEFPFLTILVSGGHCILCLAEGVTNFSVLGESLDTTPGVIFDKASRRLKLKNIKSLTFVHGGVAIEKMAENGNPLAIKYPIINRPRDCNFVFTHYLSYTAKIAEEEEEKFKIMGDKLLPNVNDICASFQFSIFKYICERVELGMRYLKTVNIKTKSLVLSGGVASNSVLRKMLGYICKENNYKLIVPPVNLCTDNGVMVAWNGIEKMMENIPVVSPDQLNSVETDRRWPMGKNISSDVVSYISKGKYTMFTQAILKDLKLEKDKDS